MAELVELVQAENRSGSLRQAIKRRHQYREALFSDHDVLGRRLVVSAVSAGMEGDPGSVPGCASTGASPAIHHEVGGQSKQVGLRLPDVGRRCGLQFQIELLEQVLDVGVAAAAGPEKANQAVSLFDEDLEQFGRSALAQLQ